MVIFFLAREGGRSRWTGGFASGTLGGQCHWQWLKRQEPNPGEPQGGDFHWLTQRASPSSTSVLGSLCSTVQWSTVARGKGGKAGPVSGQTGCCCQRLSSLLQPAEPCGAPGAPPRSTWCTVFQWGLRLGGPSWGSGPLASPWRPRLRASVLTTAPPSSRSKLLSLYPSAPGFRAQLIPLWMDIHVQHDNTRTCKT